jgi:hypothetical protein
VHLNPLLAANHSVTASLHNNYEMLGPCVSNRRAINYQFRNYYKFISLRRSISGAFRDFHHKWSFFAIDSSAAAAAAIIIINS